MGDAPRDEAHSCAASPKDAFSLADVLMTILLFRQNMSSRDMLNNGNPPSPSKNHN
jgi:hypothetical protein